jgi:hypothetical protein
VIARAAIDPATICEDKIECSSLAEKPLLAKSHDDVEGHVHHHRSHEHLAERELSGLQLQSQQPIDPFHLKPLRYL